MHLEPFAPAVDRVAPRIERIEKLRQQGAMGVIRKRHRVGAVYMPIPIGGFLTLLFLIERVWVGAPPATSVMYSDAASELE